jgi:hypothetical protein
VPENFGLTIARVRYNKLSLNENETMVGERGIVKI